MLVLENKNKIKFVGELQILRMNSQLPFKLETKFIL